ncbi:hypothetical protein BDD12DRAFT_885801 [Trichophaea hybrida]|nr:hypothetical protein BDD12DRAFT_885801 [Trichophaea hybrida]
MSLDSGTRDKVPVASTQNHKTRSATTVSHPTYIPTFHLRWRNNEYNISTMYERTGLHDLDPELPEEQWPLLELTNVTVYHGDSLVDLFDVAEKGPFRVRGKLQKVARKWKGIERSQKVYNNDLVIPKVYTYSIEQVPGEVELKIWLLGKAGWYSIKPAPEYCALFAQGMEKAELWSFVDDTYLDSFTEGKKVKGTMDSLVMEYYKEHRSPASCPDLAAAWGLFEKYHRFLIVKILEKQDMRDSWAQTPVFQYCISKYPTEIREVKVILQRQAKKHDEAREKISPPPPPPPPMSQSSTPRSSATVSETTSRVNRRKRQVKLEKEESPTTTPTRKRPYSSSWSRTIHKFLENYIRMQDVPAGDITLDKIAEILYENFEVESQSQARDIMIARGGELCILMEESQQHQWENRRAFMQLQKATVPANAKELLALRPLRRQVILNKVVIATGLSPPQSSPEVKKKHPKVGGKGRKSGRIKQERQSPDKDLEFEYYSLLDPSPSPSPSPSPPPPPPPPLSASLDPDTLHHRFRKRGRSSSPESEYDEPNPLIRNSAKGKGKSALRPIKSSTPRPPSSPLEPPDSDSDSNTLATRFANLKRTLEGPSPSQSFTKRMRTEEISLSPTDSPPPDYWPDLRPGLGRPPIEVMKLPDTTTIVGGVWRCSMDGCAFKVLDADTPEGKWDIEEHYGEHGRTMRNAMETMEVEVVPRQGKNVGNLVAKIEDMARRWRESHPSPSLEMLQNLP